MPLTTTSGYTFPVGGIPTTQTPSSGAVNTPVDSKGSAGYIPYDQWDGSWLDYAEYLSSKNPALADRWAEWFLQEKSNATARQWTASREDSQFQRFAEDARKAGFNPVALMNLGGQPVSSSSSGSSYSGSQFTSIATNKNTTDTSLMRGLIAAYGAIITAIIGLAIL